MNPAPRTRVRPCNLVIVGASTGGPRVLFDLLAWLPPLRACVLIVQHAPKFINASFVRSLSLQTRAPVRLAQTGDCLTEGTVFVAPSETHCVLVSNTCLSLVEGPRVNFVCPSIDVTMRSLSAPVSARLIGVLLTGMGRDGAAGLAHMKGLGGLTVAQNEETCAVYGMPAEAVKLGCVDFELAPEQIARLLAYELGA